MTEEESPSNQAYVLLNVDYKHQQNIINKAKSLPTVKNVKTMYGIYEVMIILESNDMHAIKKTIDDDIHNLDGITNMTSLVSVGSKDIHSILE
jgi:DNA-binding Lrp family transcriptional regulator|tara:strand:+ start:742 stop:1020 length:279 start_codon:yes stop_codon:yes gene_type:complete